jgi:hypothetical protein
MKRYLRLCLVFLISLTLPLSGMAGVQAPTEPCPMKTLGVATMDGMGMDCCNDLKSPVEHGKPCKPGQQCKTGGMLQVSIVKPAVALSHPIVLSFSSDFLPVQSPSGVWRPPRA